MSKTSGPSSGQYSTKPDSQSPGSVTFSCSFLPCRVIYTLGRDSEQISILSTSVRIVLEGGF